jgi:LAS superfamily LD-carboxypeptidase LdcB
MAVALASGPPTPEYPDRGAPLGDRAMREDLKELGYRNARLPRDLLVEVESNTRRRCRIEQQAAEAWELMIVHAAADGIRLQAISCYRNLKTQEWAYKANCPITEVPVSRTVTTKDENGETVTETVTATTSKRVCKVPTAKPGNSNHGWGRAVDIAYRGRILTCRSKAFKWLQQNAHLYGWVHPGWAHCGRVKEEAWHWEWAGTAELPPTRTGLIVAI